MSQIRKGIFGSLAIGLTLGAVQLAFANELIGTRQAVSAVPGTPINRTAKADRAPVPASSGQTRTIVLRQDGLPDTSVLVKVPVTTEESRARNETRNGPAAPATRPGPKKTTIACEPPVSVLTEVAKLLQPGRCVT